MASKVTTTKYIVYEERPDGVTVASYIMGDYKIGFAEAEVIMDERKAVLDGKSRRLVAIAPPSAIEVSPAAQQLFGSAYGQQGFSAIAMIIGDGEQATRANEFLDSKVEKTGILIRAFVTVQEGIDWISEL